MLKCCCCIDWCVGALVVALFGGLVHCWVHCLVLFWCIVYCVGWCVVSVEQLFWLLGLFDCCYYCLLLYLVLVCRLVLGYALFFYNLHIRLFADALMFGTGLLLMLSCWFLFWSLLVFVRWLISLFVNNLIDYCCFFCLLILLFIICFMLSCCCCIDWCVGALGWFFDWCVVFVEQLFWFLCFLFVVIFVICCI